MADLATVKHEKDFLFSQLQELDKQLIFYCKELIRMQELYFEALGKGDTGGQVHCKAFIRDFQKMANRTILSIRIVRATLAELPDEY